MKKVAITIIFLLFLSVTGAFAENNFSIVEKTFQAKKDGVLVADTKETTKIAIPKCTGATSGQVRKIVRLENAAVLETAKAAKKSADDAVTATKSLTEVAGLLTGASESQTTAINNNTKALDGLAKAAKDTTTEVKTVGGKIDGFQKYFWIIIGLSIIGFGIIAGLIIYFSCRNKKAMTSQTVKVLKAIEEVPKYFDPTPFTYDIEGKHVECNFSVPEDECYLTLKIESTNGSQNPADFERQALDKHKRGLAAKYVRGTMIKFLKGGLAGTNEEALINHLWKVKKEITIS